MDSSKKTSPEFRDSDADVSFLLYKTGRALKQFFIWLGKIPVQIGLLLFSVLMFLFRNILWLIAGALLGLGYGYYTYSNEGPHYTSQLTVKANFYSTRSLYNTVEYLNSLIAANNTADLAKMFGISPKEADQLIEFSCINIESELITANMYRDQFMEIDPNPQRTRQDTFWLRTIKYGDFKESLTKFDYPFHEITLKSLDPAIFPKLEKGLVNYISQTELLQAVRNQQVTSNNDEEKLLVKAIQNLDTLRQAYNQRLIKGEQTNVSPGNQLTVLQANPEINAPELELYDKMVELLDQLKKSRIRTSTETDVIQVLSSFNPVGRKLTFLKQNGTRDILAGLVLAVVILAFIAIYKKLGEIEKTKRTKKTL